MNDNSPYFNSQSRYVIVKRIMKISGEPFSFESFIEKDNFRTDNIGPYMMSLPTNLPPLSKPIIKHKFIK